VFGRLGEEAQTAQDRGNTLERTKQKLEQTLDEVCSISSVRARQG